MWTSNSAAAPELARWPRIGGVPHPQLRGLLARGYAGFTDAPAHRFAAPAKTAVTLVLKLCDSPSDRPPEFVNGARSSYWIPEGACAPSYLEVWLAPLGAYRLLGLPLDALSGQIVDLREVLGAPGRRLGEQVREAPNWPRRFALLDEFLLRRAQDAPQPAPAVGWAWRRLVATSGKLPISRLAAEVGWSHKHLITRFTQQIGLPPKTAARLVRFDAVCRRVATHPPARWGEIAADSGYADQAHLVRDFHEFTGATPTAFLTHLQAQTAAHLPS